MFVVGYDIDFAEKYLTYSISRDCGVVLRLYSIPAIADALDLDGGQAYLFDLLPLFIRPTTVATTSCTPRVP